MLAFVVLALVSSVPREVIG